MRNKMKKRHFICIVLILVAALSWRWRNVCRDMEYSMNSANHCVNHSFPEFKRNISVCAGFIPNGFSLNLGYRATVFVFDLNKNLLGFYDLGEEYMDGIGDKSGPYVDEDTFDLGLLGQGSEFDTTPWFHRRLEAKLIERMCKK